MQDNTTKPAAPPSKPTEQQQISLKLPTTLLARVDAAAARFNTSRAGYIKMTLSKAAEVDAP